MLFFSKQEVAVLLFHRILPERDEMWDPIDPLLFEQTLQYARKKFHVVSLDEILFNRTNISAKPLAAITFDDGYRDFIDYAVPVLDKYKMTASMYLVSDCIDKNIPTWTYIIDHLFTRTRKLDWKNFDFPFLPAEFLLPKWNTAKDRISYCKGIKQYLKWIPAGQRNSIMESMLLNFDDVPAPGGMMMSWKDVQQIQHAGFSIGSHSVSHPTLATIQEDAEVAFELSESASRIEKKTGTRPTVFSYPIGSYDERVKKLTANAGYKAALAVNKQPYDPAKHDLFEVPRIELYNESWLKTKMRTNGAISYFNQLKGK